MGGAETSLTYSLSLSLSVCPQLRPAGTACSAQSARCTVGMSEAAASMSLRSVGYPGGVLLRHGVAGATSVIQGEARKKANKQGGLQRFRENPPQRGPTADSTCRDSYYIRPGQDAETAPPSLLGLP